ncbi:relaxin receptor 2a isoform 2-T2 [Synchiropus picturatus]
MELCAVLLLLHLSSHAKVSALKGRTVGSSQCPLGHFPCGNMSECLPQALQCNGHQDCSNGADESLCGDNFGFADLFGERVQRNEANELMNECFLQDYPEFCSCSHTEVECVEVNLQEVPPLPSNVTWLSLRGNEIQLLPDFVFFECTSLERLFMQNNHLNFISKDAFSGMHNLERLFLSENFISSLTPGVFKDLRQLQWLILDHNPLGVVSPESFYGLQSVMYLSMVNTSLRQIQHPSFCQHMPALDWLDLEGNFIQDLNYSILKTCNSLEVLVLIDNQIQRIPENTFQSLWKLADLNLAKNRISELSNNTFRSMSKSLRKLNVSYNPSLRIRSSNFIQLTNLQSLALEGIEIPEIQTTMFLPMANLSHIYFKSFQYCSYAPHVRSCKPNTDGISSFEDLLANTVLRVSVWVIAFFTCFGNLLVIGMRSVIQAENKLHGVGIKVLCCADCLMGVYLFFVGAFDMTYRGQYNRYALLWMESVECRTIGFLAMLSSEVSVLLLTYLTLEKFLVIVFPFRNLRPGKLLTGVILVSIWVLGFVIAAVPLIYAEIFGNYYGRNGVCFPLHSDMLEKPTAKEYSTGIFLGLNLVAFLVIVVSYFWMFFSIYKTGINATALRRRRPSDVAVANRFFFIVFSDALCWIPIFVVKALSLLEVEIPGTISSWVVIFILPINSALNPILYTLTTSFFREQVELLLCKWQRKRTLKKDPKSLTSSTIFMDSSLVSCEQHSAYLQQVCGGPRCA